MPNTVISDAHASFNAWGCYLSDALLFSPGKSIHIIAKMIISDVFICDLLLNYRKYY